MTKTASLATVAAFLLAGAAAAQACQHPCGYAPVIEKGPVVYKAPVVKYASPKLPRYFVIEHGPLYEGVGAYGAPRVYAPQVATYKHPYIYGYGVGFSGGPVVLGGYPYVKRARHHGKAPLSVYY